MSLKQQSITLIRTLDFWDFSISRYIYEHKKLHCPTQLVTRLPQGRFHGFFLFLIGFSCFWHNDYFIMSETFILLSIPHADTYPINNYKSMYAYLSEKDLPHKES